MPIYGLGFDSGNLIAASGHHENIWIWNLKDEKSQKIHTKHVGNIWCVSYRLNGQLTSAGVDGSVRISDSSNQKVIHFSLHDGAIYWLHYSNDGKSIASSSADGTIRVLNINVLDATLSRDVNELLKESEKNTGLTIENSVVVPSHEIYH